MNHFKPLKLGFGLDTIGYYSIKKPKTLIVFVHGFSGESVSTWDDFSERIYTESILDESDIIFYGYDSLGNSASESAAMFYQFIGEYRKPTNVTINRHRGTSTDFAYSKIIFMAHSLGSIVLRRALMSYIPLNPSWLQTCQMILFAPAHMGARITGILEILPDLLKVLTGTISLLGIKSLHDLKEKSTIIESLTEDTREYLKTHPNFKTSLIAQTVVWCHGDNVVLNAQFCQDPSPNIVRPSSHIKVCKPNKRESYDKPFEILKNVL